MKRAVPGLCLTLVLVVSIMTSSTGASDGSPIEPERLGSIPNTSTVTSIPRTVVAVHLVNPDFTVMQLKYRVFFNKAEVKRIPLNDYDFKVAFSDELLNALTEDKRMEWRMQTSEEQIDVPMLLKGKGSPPTVDAERILAVGINEYGAFLASLAADKFYVSAEFRLLDRGTGKKLWKKTVFERIDFDGKISEMQADNQKGLKEGINKILEKLCPKIAAEIRRARV